MTRTPLAQCVVSWVEAQAARRPTDQQLLLLIAGAQGIGKSSAMAALAKHRDYSICPLAIDDFYLTREARAALAASVHPLCATRGPPGTHDLALLEAVLGQLHAGCTTRIPAFDKRSDDRLAPADWPIFVGRPEIVVLEGWLAGALPDPNAARSDPVNGLEAANDARGTWRQWQEEALAGDYARLWDRANAFLHLQAPDFAVVENWRQEQEARTMGVPLAQLAADRAAWVHDFVLHFERITRRMLAGWHRPGQIVPVSPARLPL